jgi:hypothetical protein
MLTCRLAVGEGSGRFMTASCGSYISPQMLAYLDHSYSRNTGSVLYTDCSGSRRGRATRGAVGVVGVCEGCGFAVGADFFVVAGFFLLTPCNLRVTSAARVSGEDPADIAQVLHQTKRQ